MAGPTRTPLQRELDRLKISAAYVRGIPQAEIAKELGVSQQQVSHDLGIIRDRWLKAQVKNMDERRALELAKIDNLERQYWVEFEASKQVRETTTSGSTTKGKEQTQELKASVRRETPVTGDLGCLAGVQWCIERRIKLLGLDAPTRVDFAFVRKEAERLAEENGLDVDEVLKEAYRIVRADSAR